jgi:hypothetical protein
MITVKCEFSHMTFGKLNIETYIKVDEPWMMQKFY